MGETVTVAEHVGSTSVPGLPAKPIIDLMATAPALARDDDARARRPCRTPSAIPRES
ncbi:hypothetical protein Aab01nite_01510 [Paractinoplanes abujensis]|nr:hypothetical protein Aab01nite_01510 [Actinoplanes abujensis]